MKTRRFYVYVCMFVTLLLCTSCNEDLVLDDDNNVEPDPVVTIEIPNVLKFESSEHLQNVIGKMKAEINVSDLKSENLLGKIGLQHNLSLRALSANSEFKSLLDVNYETDLANLTASEWQIINSDPDHLVYEPEDGVISDTYLASLVNSKREIQIDNKVLKYTDNGIYMVDAADYGILADAGNPSLANDPRVEVYAPQASAPSNSNPTLSGSLTLSNGVVIPASNIRDLNFKDKGDANMITSFWTGLWGGHTVAIQKFSSNRHMVVNFYEQDYYIYKNIGTSAKMQKKVLGIWWNCDAQEIRVGWEAVELKESYNVFPFTYAQKPNFTPYLYPNLRMDEKDMPLWLSKNFPFADNYTFFLVPFLNYDIGTKDVNKLYKTSITTADKLIKAWMKAESKPNAPTGMGFMGLETNGTIRYLIGQAEDGNTKKNSLEKKFLSEWFGGTYIIGYTTDPNSPNFKFSKFTFTIKGNGTKLGRGNIYGAVKYDGKWLAARILKSE